MLASMTSIQRVEWDDMLNRWNMGEYPHYRFDLNAAMQMVLQANLNRRRGRPARIEDYMPKFERKAEGGGPQSPDSLRANMLKLPRKSGKAPRANRGKAKTTKEQDSGEG
jgi:hypothetical protein